LFCIGGRVGYLYLILWSIITHKWDLRINRYNRRMVYTRGRKYTYTLTTFTNDLLIC
jgi:hypothetical protein